MCYNDGMKQKLLFWSPYAVIALLLGYFFVYPYFLAIGYSFNYIKKCQAAHVCPLDDQLDAALKPAPKAAVPAPAPTPTPAEQKK